MNCNREQEQGYSNYNSRTTTAAQYTDGTSNPVVYTTCLPCVPHQLLTVRADWSIIADVILQEIDAAFALFVR
jgi:hypothetical protein